DAGGVGSGIVDTLEHVVQERRSTAAAELVAIAEGRNRIGPKRVLNPFGEGLIGHRVERLEVENHMRQALDGAIAHVIAWAAARPGCRSVALKCCDLGRPAAAG